MAYVANSEEKTGLNDAVHKAKQAAAANSEAPKRTNLNDKQKAAIALGTVLLGGTAFVAIGQNDDGSVAIPGANGQGVPPTDSTATTVVPKPEVAHGVTHQVASGTICPKEEVAIAHNVNEAMTFDQAFAAARDEVGSGGVFSWHGEVYNTFYKEEWNALSLTQKQEYMASLEYKPTPDPTPDPTPNPTPDPDPTPNPNPNPDPTPNPTPDPKPDPKPDPTPVVLETTIDGRPAVAIDNNGDGMVDAVVFLDPETNSPMALMDSDGGNSLDTLAILDPRTLEPVSSTPLDQPFEVTMDEVVATNEANLNTNNDVVVADDETDDDDQNDDIAMNDDYSHDDNVDDIA